MSTVIDLRVYRLSAVKKAAYRLADRCTAVLGEIDGHQLPVSFRFAGNISDRDANTVIERFFQELLDQELREQIADETASIRALILAQAFSNIDLIKRDG